MGESERIAELTAELAWLRRLSRALLRDEGDDLAHDTWLVAAKQAPADGRPLRPWLSRVARNFARMGSRSNRRRERREQASQDVVDPTPSPEALVARAEAQRMLVDAVLALDEPHRSTVLLHYFEEVPSAEIGRRLGIPDGTVRRRLKEALDQLRSKLGASDQKRARILAPLLAPLAGHRSPITSALATKALSALIVVALAVGIIWKRTRSASMTAASSHASPAFAFMRGNPEPHPSIPSWIAQGGVAPRRIAGRVVANEAPLAGATVTLGLRLGGDAVRPIAEATTAANGVFDFGQQPAAIFVISATAPQHSSAAATLASANPRTDSGHIVLELGDCHSQIVGTVADSGGGAIVHAHVSLSGLSGIDSDSNGHYALCLVPRDVPGTATARVRIDADGYGSIEEQVIVGGELHHDFVLAPEAVLVGRVTANDRPVAGALVTAIDRSGRGRWAAGSWSESDPEGHFRIAGLAPGKFELSATADHLGTSAPIVAVAWPAATSRDIHVPLAELAQIHGRVVMDGAPVAGVTVSITRSSRSSVSQPDGSFVLDHVPYGVVALVARSYDVTSPASISVATRNVSGVELDVAMRSMLHGHVTRNGHPVPAARLMCGTGQLMQHPATADADGAFVVDGLTAGLVICTAWDPRDRAFAAPAPFQLAAAEDRNLDLEIDSAGEVKGNVVDEAGHPVGGAYVRIEVANEGNDMCEAISDVRGAFDCAMLGGGEYDVTIAPSPSSRQGFAPVVGDHFQTIQVPNVGIVSGVTLAVKNERVTIRGIVVDDAGAALGDVQIDAIGRGRSAMGFAFALSSPDGHFEIGDLAPGEYNLHARAADGGETELVGIASGRSDVAITLARPGEIDGTFSGFASAPVVTASMFTSDLKLGGVAIVDGNSFVASGLPPGRYTVEAQAGGAIDSQTVDVRSSEITHMTLSGRGSGRIEGRVTEFGTNAPVVGMRCETNLSTTGQMVGIAPAGAAQQAFTDSTGHFSVAAPIGYVRVFCFSPNSTGMTVAGTDVEVTANEAPNVALVSVRPTYGTAPANAGFSFTRLVLPLTIDKIDPTRAAAKSGLAAGDHVVTIDGTTLQGVLPRGAAVLVMNHKPGSTVAIGVERGGEIKTIAIPVGS